MATPKIPALLDPTAYGVTLTPGTYTDLVAGTLGNIGDPSDGFEAKLSQSAARHQAHLDSLPALDQDVLALGAVAPYFDTHPAADMAAQLQPVADAINADLAAFAGLVLPPIPTRSKTGVAIQPIGIEITIGGTGPTTPGPGPGQPPT